MSLHDRIEFAFISFMHDTMYGIFMDAEKLLVPSGIKKEQKVLEVGCGPGFFTIPAAEIVGNKGLIYAIDINPFAIKKVEKKIKKANIKNVKVMLADVTDTKLQENSIDVAFFFGVIHNLIGIIEDVIKEMYRILKPNGTIAIQKGRKSKTNIITIITKNKYFRFLEEKDRVILFQKVE
ncbi:MAG: class I SAM-dependent methyltransferase [Candidatus Thorarchaeota archaeon]